jgi:hypothetical protein
MTITRNKRTPDDLITQAEAARLVGRSVKTIHTHIRMGNLRGYENPKAPVRQGRVMVSREEVLGRKWR